MRWLAALLTLCLALPAVADAIPGENDPGYEAAVAMWLAGEDLPALKALSTLAQDDNAAAQILLAQIAANGHLHAHVTGVLARKSRIELLRQPGGLSGKSWLTAASDVPLARALLDSKDSAKFVDAARGLLAEGEPGAAVKQLHRALVVWDLPAAEDIAREIAPVLEGDNAVLTPMIHFVQFLIRGVSTDPNWPVEKSVAALDNDPEGRLTWYPVAPLDFLENAALRALVLTHAQNVAAFEPLKTFCTAACPQSVNSCTAIGAIELFQTGPLPFNSPSERLIPNDVYWQSDRMQGDLVRRFKYSAARAQQFAPHDACFYPALKSATSALR